MSGPGLIAPFWSDIDVNRFGSVFYRLTTNSSSADLEQAIELTGSIFPGFESNLTSVLVATWYRVAETDIGSQVCTYACMQHACVWVCVVLTLVVDTGRK